MTNLGTKLLSDFIPKCFLKHDRVGLDVEAAATMTGYTRMKVFLFFFFFFNPGEKMSPFQPPTGQWGKSGLPLLIGTADLCIFDKSPPSTSHSPPHFWRIQGK